MKKLLLPLFMLLLAPQFVSGQITIPETVLTSLVGNEQTVTSYEFTNTTGLQAIVDADGANQTWDFTNIPVGDPFVVTSQYISLPAEIPGANNAQYADADFAIVVESDTADVYLYQSIDAGAHMMYGFTGFGDLDDDGTDEEFSTFNTPASKIGQFPIQFGNTWSDSTSLSIGGVITTAIQVTEVTVDGWGTLITPEGSVDALREKRVTRSYSPLLPQIQTTTTLYSFLAASGIAASIVVDASGNIISGEYDVLDSESSTDIERIGESVPSTFVLEQNYPNPFNPSTNIAFSIPEPANVQLTVFNITGQEVARLAAGTYSAGTYEIGFDATELASGLYLYKLEAGSFVQTRLMSLVK